MPAQQLRNFHLAELVLAHQRLHNPRFFEFARAAAGAIQPIDSGLGGAFVSLHEPGGKRSQGRPSARRTQTFKSVDQFVAILSTATDDRRQLSVALQRPRHGTFRFRYMQPVASVVFTDLPAVSAGAVLAPVPLPFPNALQGAPAAIGTEALQG